MALKGKLKGKTNEKPSGKLKGKITERSLYPGLHKFLSELGFSSFVELSCSAGQLDILAKFNEDIFIIEIKIGERSKKLIEGMSQALRYAEANDTHNIIILNYPPEIRDGAVEELTSLTLETKINTLVFTKYLNGSKDISAKNLFESLEEKISQKTSEVSIKLVVDVISESIHDITNILKRISKKNMEQLIDSVTGKFELFKALSELKNENELKNNVINLISYLLINQIVFYHIYNKKTENLQELKKIPDLSPIRHLDDLKDQFEKIQIIDFKAIYQIDVISKMPENEDIIETINNVISILKIVKPELIQHDLIGRMFHEILPFETRKILAAFYTNPIAADILSNLAITKFDSKVVDLACGSGTLLVSSYNRKKSLAKNADFAELHKQFVERELTGLDLMPFAAHITAVNLSSQSFEVTTNQLNIGVMDSLSLSLKFKKNESYIIKDFSQELQSTFKSFDTSQKKLAFFIDSVSEGSVTADGDIGEFSINRNSYDVCIMNPPFSDREKMPQSYLNVLNTYSSLNEICGSRINLWGYFLAICDDILKEDGILAFVIPINFFRGRATEKIRDHILKNYRIKYVVKTGKDTAFSEDAAFRDILLIAEKVKPKLTDTTRFIILNEKLHSLHIKDAQNIANFITGKSFTSSNNLDIIDFKHKDLLEFQNNLMPLFGVMQTKSSKIFFKFNQLISRRFGKKLRKLNSNEISEGFHASPKGISQMAFITKNFGKNRVKRAFLILKNERKDIVTFQVKGLPEKTLKIKRSKLQPAFRTLTDVDTYDISDKLDYIISDKFDEYDLVLNLSEIENKGKFDYKLIRDKMRDKQTNIVVARRFRPNSKNTSHFAFCSDIPFFSPHTFKILKLDSESAKITTLYLNSIMGILNLISLKEQTTQSYTDIMESDLVQFDIIDITKITPKEKQQLLELYEILKTENFESLLTQFENQTSARVKLDMSLLKILGLKKKEIDEMLPELYQTIAFELKMG